MLDKYRQMHRRHWNPPWHTSHAPASSSLLYTHRRNENPTQIYCLCSLCWINESEQVVVDKVAAALWHEGEALDVGHGLWLIVNHQCTSYQHHNSSQLIWLRIYCIDSVDNFVEGKVLEGDQPDLLNMNGTDCKLVDYVRSTLIRLFFESQHRLVSLHLSQPSPCCGGCIQSYIKSR